MEITSMNILFSPSGAYKSILFCDVNGVGIANLCSAIPYDPKNKPMLFFWAKGAKRQEAWEFFFVRNRISAEVEDEGDAP